VKKRFSEEQIIGFLREAEKGIPVKDLCRKHGFSDASFYLWRGKYGGMDVSDAKRLKALEAENARLKRLLADAMLERTRSRKRRYEKNGSRPGASRAGAVDGNARIERTTMPGGGRHERELLSLPAAAGSERGAASSDRGSGAAPPTLRLADDLLEA